MKHVMIAAIAVLLLTGCASRMSVETMREIAEARDVCAELNGTFKQWHTEGGYGWRCDFGTDGSN